MELVLDLLLGGALVYRFTRRAGPTLPPAWRLHGHRCHCAACVSGVPPFPQPPAVA
jgi:hypothetical protein